tara:strand:- start:200 stop:709 length:510 start_codon:yes stop_codon:yes gene_type:complete
MKKTDIQREDVFIEYFIISGNASESAKRAGYKSNPAQVGYYLKNKLSQKIEQRLKDEFKDMVPQSVNVLKAMLNSKSDNVKLSTCKYILSELTQFNSSDKNNQDANNIQLEESEFEQVYQAISEIPEYLTDTEQQEIINSEKDNMDENDKNFKILIKSIYAAKLKQKDQ